MQRNHLRPACRCEWRVSLRENRLSPNWFRNRLSPNSFEKRLSPNSPRRRAPSPRLRRTAGRSLDFVFSLCFALQGRVAVPVLLPSFFPYTLFGCPVSLSRPLFSRTTTTALLCSTLATTLGTQAPFSIPLSLGPATPPPTAATVRNARLKRTNRLVERLSLNRSQCGGCSTRYDTPTKN